MNPKNDWEIEKALFPSGQNAPVVVTKVAIEAVKFTTRLVRDQDFTNTVFDPQAMENGLVIDLCHGITNVVEEELPWSFFTETGGTRKGRWFFMPPVLVKRFCQLRPNPLGNLEMSQVGMTLNLLAKASIASTFWTDGAGGIHWTSSQDKLTSVNNALEQYRNRVAEGSLNYVTELAQCIQGQARPDGTLERRRPGAMVILQASSIVEEGKIALHPSLFKMHFPDEWERRKELRTTKKGPMWKAMVESFIPGSYLSCLLEYLDYEWWSKFPSQALLNPQQVKQCLKGDSDGDQVMLIFFKEEEVPKVIAFRYPPTPATGRNQGGLLILDVVLITKKMSQEFWSSMELRAEEPDPSTLKENTWDHRDLNLMIQATLSNVGIKALRGASDDQASQVLNPDVFEETGIEDGEWDTKPFSQWLKPIASSFGWKGETS